ncbi:MAG: RNA-binding protein [Clostridia bacterium]|nr:RNA-binding protein [Clostridia bacterium]
METEEKLLLSRAEDTLWIAEKRYQPKTLGFLTPKERVFLQRNLQVPTDMQVFYDGGYEDAERVLMVAAPEFCAPVREEYLTALVCTGREIDGLSHRDYLGSLMGLGIVRESVGDILVGPEKTYLFIKPEQTEYLLQNLTKIGRRGIHLAVCPADEIMVPERETKEVNATVSSLRLDSVLSAAIGLARGKTAELICSGVVTVNWETEEAVSRILKEGDMISARGYGRMQLSHIGGLTRKGRQAITISRYI